MPFVYNPFTGNLDAVAELSTSTPVSGFTAGSLLFIDSSNTLAEDNASLFYDDTYNGFYLGRSAPTRPAKLLIYRKSTDVVGTVSTTAASGTVTGSGTLFQTQVFVGDKIVVNGETRTVLTVTSDTALTTDAWTGNNTAQSYSLLFVGAGRVSTTSGSGTVTGTGTAFLQDVAVDDTITVNGETRTVSAIASNTSLTTDNWSASNTTQTYLQTVQRVASVGYSAMLARQLTLSKDSVDGGGAVLFTGSNTVAQTSTSTNTNIQATSFSMSVTLGARNTNDWTDTPGLTVCTPGAITQAGATGTVTNFEVMRSRFAYAATGATITNTRLYTTGPNSNSGTMTNTYGYHCGDITTGTQTNTPYSFYAEDANAISFYGAGKVGINQTAPTGMLDVVSSASTVITTIIKGASSQSANLTEWQNNSSTVLSAINASGYLGVGLTTALSPIHIQSNNQDGLRIARTSATAGSYEVYVASNGRLNWYDNLAGAVRWGMTTTGEVFFGTSNIASTYFTVINNSASNIGMVVRMAASQTANAWSVQNSSGTDKVFVNSTGYLVASNFMYLDGVGSSAYWAYVGGNMLTDRGIDVGGVHILNTSSEAVFNEGAADINFRVEGDTQANLFFVDAGLDKIGINQATPEAKLHITESTLGNEVFRIESVATNDDVSERVFQQRVTTTDATPTTIMTIAAEASKTTACDVTIVCRRTGGVAGTAEDGGFFKFTTQYNNLAGTATIIGADTSLVAQSSTGTIGVASSASSGNILIQVTGDVDTNLVWHATVKIYKVGT